MNLEIVKTVQSYNIALKQVGKEMVGSCPFHQDGKRPNLRVNQDKNSWICDVCGIGGGPIEFIAKKENRNKKDVYRELQEKEQPIDYNNPAAIYDYQDRYGNLVYQVVRFVPKTFKQRQLKDGKWVWGLDGVEKTIYKLPEVLKNRYVWIVEGEKDVETLRSIGLCATCNSGGAKKWHDSFSEYLKGKDVVVCGDTDQPGREHVKMVVESVEKHAASVRNITLDGFKDVSDLRASFNNSENFKTKLMELVEAAPVLVGGGVLPIKSMAELEAEYRESLEAAKTRTVNLSNWLPSLRCVRPLVGGELVALVGDTGSAKTYCLQHIAMHARVPTLLFELELPGCLTFERFAAIASKTPAAAIADKYDGGESVDYSDVGHVFVCTKSRVSPDDIESIILRSELKMGVRPTLVLVDYIQLIRGTGKSRYEQISNVAEQLKIVAKSTGTVIVMASQVGRDKDDPEIRLHDAKDSGSIENSAGVVIGIWRSLDDKGTQLLNVRVLKNTKGRPSDPIQCNLSESMRITERSKIADEDVY